MLTNTEGTLFNTSGESRGTSFGRGPGIKFQTCRAGRGRGERGERRRGREEREGEEERREEERRRGERRREERGGEEKGGEEERREEEKGERRRGGEERREEEKRRGERRREGRKKEVGEDEKGMVQVIEVVGAHLHTGKDTFIFLKFLAFNEYRDSHTNTSSSEKPCTSTQQVRGTFTEFY